jgi:multiple sugar transport system permease protein
MDLNETNSNDVNDTPQKNGSFWKDGLSIDESKVSILIICLLLSLIFTVVMYIKTGEINGNWTAIVTAIIYAVAGVNAFNTGMGYMNNMFSSLDIQKLTSAAFIMASVIYLLVGFLFSSERRLRRWW